MDPKTITLNGGVMLTVSFEPLADGTVPPPASIKVRQIPVRDYEAGFPFVDDEPALVGFVCGLNKAWALTLSPDSFEEVLATGREVNAKGFFTHCQRRMERIQREQAALYGAIATMPPETVKQMMEKGLAMQNRSHLPTLSPGYVSPPVR
ncbi:MAG: hypothetical protein WCH99_04800 [Verrucomicrobiota bacterium]